MSHGPAELAGLEHKGRIEIGADADLVALAEDETFVVTEDLIRHRYPITPYLGKELAGVVRGPVVARIGTDRRHGRRSVAQPGRARRHGDLIPAVAAGHPARGAT